MSSEYLSASEGLDHHLGAGEGSPNPASGPNSSRPGNTQDARALRRGRVRFNSTSEANDAANRRSSVPTRQQDRSLSPIPAAITPPGYTMASPSHSRISSRTTLLRSTPEGERGNPFDDYYASSIPSPVVRPRPSVYRSNASLPSPAEDEGDIEKVSSAMAARGRAQRVATYVRGDSAPASARTSLDGPGEDSIQPLPANGGPFPVRIDDIPMVDLKLDKTYDGAGLEYGLDVSNDNNAEAQNLVRTHTRRLRPEELDQPRIESGQATPTGERASEDYVPRPSRYRPGVLSTLLRIKVPASRGGSPASGALVSPGPSGTTTPNTQKWYHQRNQSQDTLAGLVEATNILSGAPKKLGRPIRPGMGKRTDSAGSIRATVDRLTGRMRVEDEIKVTIHIAETLSRQRYLLKLCDALMIYGSPTHRLEESMTMSARVLEMDAQFLYLPGCMIVSFDDAATHTTDVNIVKATQGIDLGRLKDVHEIYKEVVHDVISVNDAIQRLDAIKKAAPRYNKWLLVLVYGFASATVGPYAFEGRLVDMPAAGVLGCLVGFLQLIVAPRSPYYSNVFEISAAVLTSFCARGLGSIRGGELFCFSALAQSAIVLILPGYTVLCGSLELQSRSLVAGSVRMFYAIIYSLFLGYGITIGTAIYGLIDSNATSNTHCKNQLPPYYRFIFVPMFTLCLTVINKAKWKQTPVMIMMAFAGYVVNFFSTRRFPTAPQVSNTLGALTVGVLGNLYSRVRHGVAATALIPAIFVQVPSGLAAGGSLLAGLSTADQLTNTTMYPNGTSKINGTGGVGSTEDLNAIMFNVGFSMIQVAIGITVGLFMAALIVYPFGKRRSGLFSF